MLLRPQPQHVDSLFECLRHYNVHRLTPGKTLDPDFPQDSILQVRNEIAVTPLETRSYIGLTEDRVDGFCSWDWHDEGQNEAKTVLICVRAEARGTGLGAQLQEQRMQDMKDAGARKIHTWSDDPKAIEWYQRKFGYKPVGQDEIRHTLHIFTIEGEYHWAVHRGFPDQTLLTHLVLDL